MPTSAPTADRTDDRTDDDAPQPALLVRLERDRLAGGLSLDEWADLAAALCPAEYDDPPPPPAPAQVLSREARIAVMARRESAGLGLYHPDDAWQHADGDELRVGVGMLPRAMNGSDREGGVRRAA